MIVSLMQVSATTFGQNVTLKENRISLEKVFNEITRQTGYNVFLSSDQVKLSTTINVDFKDLALTKAIEKVLAGLPLSYSLEQKTIVIKEKEKSLMDRIIGVFANIDVSGKVVDENGQPIAGANIRVKGSSQATTSDSEGNFILRAVEENAVLEISYLGYQLKEIKASKNIGNIKMELAVGKLEEVSVNAGYYSVKERELTGSIARIGSKDIENQPVTNVFATMYGRMPGVNITQASGAPGGNFQIRIRGQNSLRDDGNDPLYIVDGVPFSSQTIGANQTAGFAPGTTSPLNSINPSDISSIEILKDADATAIYGSRGANGVVLITTKRGKVGKTAFNIGASTSFSKITTFTDRMNTVQYLAMRAQGYANDNITPYPTSAYDINGTWDKNRYTNWQKELIGGTAKVNNFQGAVSGGSEKTQFMLGTNYRTETTVLPGDFRYDKGGVNFNIKHGTDADNFNMVLSANYNVQRNDQPTTDLTEISRNLAPNAPALYDGNGGLNWDNGTWENPLAKLQQEFIGKVNTLVAGSVLSYRISPVLSLKANMGYTDIRNVETKVSPYTIYNPSYGLTSASSSIYLNNTTRYSWTIEPQLTWKSKIGQGNFEGLVGTSFLHQESDRLVQFGSGFSSNSLIYNLASATTRSVNVSDKTVYKYQAIFARLNYNLKGTYIFNITGRRDGSSRFGPNKRFAEFGALGAAWVFSNEAFLKDNGILSFGKIRGSYGITGNDQIGDYQYYNTYASTGVSYENSVGIQPTRLFNPNFGWESNTKLELAMEAGFFKDKVFATAAWYNNRSSNQLVGIPLPGTTGFTSLTANLAATVRNTGLEFTIRTVNINKKNFQWETSFNISANRNRLIAFPGLESSTYANTYKIGKPLDIRNLYQYAGVNPANGVYRFIDFNNDNQITSLEDRKFVADLTPRFFGGLENQLKFKDFSLNFLFQFVKQKNTFFPAGIPGSAINQPTYLLNVWQRAGDNSEYQKFSSGANNETLTAFYRYADSNGALTDASFIRLKNISISYDFPPIIRGTARLRLYFKGQNLFTFTPFKNGDPELRFGSFLPPLRVGSFGVQVQF